MEDWYCMWAEILSATHLCFCHAFVAWSTVHKKSSCLVAGCFANPSWWSSFCFCYPGSLATFLFPFIFFFVSIHEFSFPCFSFFYMRIVLITSDILFAIPSFPGEFICKLCQVKCSLLSSTSTITAWSKIFIFFCTLSLHCLHVRVLPNHAYEEHSL